MTKLYRKGFSLIELLVGLAILTVVFCFSVSYLPSLYKKNKLETVTDSIKNAIYFARLEALSTGKSLVLSHLPGKKDWSEGMILFVDNTYHQYQPNAKILQEWHWPSSGLSIQWRGFQSTNYLLFSSVISSSDVNGYFSISNSKQKVKLVVNRLGRVIPR